LKISISRGFKSERRKQMTKAEATKLGWEFSGSKNDATAEKGRLIHMGPLNFVLKLIEKLEEK
jgi:hypothetical protein